MQGQIVGEVRQLLLSQVSTQSHQHDSTLLWGVFNTSVTSTPWNMGTGAGALAMPSHGAVRGGEWDGLEIPGQGWEYVGWYTACSLVGYSQSSTNRPIVPPAFGGVPVRGSRTPGPGEPHAPGSLSLGLGE